MDRLDILIARQETLILDLENKLSQAKAYLAFLKKGIDLDPLNQDTSLHIQSGRKGRQKGAISHKWREVFSHMVQSGHPNSFNEIMQFANSVGIDLTSKSVEIRTREYEKNGLLKSMPNGRFIVSEDTVRKFNLDKV